MKTKAGFTVLAMVLGLTGLVGLAALREVRGSERPTYSLELQENRFVPEIMEVPANQKFNLVVTNATKTREEFESIDLNREKTVASGESETIVLGPLTKGTYKFFQDHRGTFTAKGQLIVKEKNQK